MPSSLSKPKLLLSIVPVLLSLLLVGLRKQVVRLLRRLRSIKDAEEDLSVWPIEPWLDKHREEAIDPDFEIIDPHHHLWDPRFHPKGWGIPLEMIQMWYFSTKPGEINKKTMESMARDAPAALSSFVGRSRRQAPFSQPYMGAEFEFDIRNRDCGKRGHNVVQTVYLQCGWDDTNVEEALRPLGEVRMVEKVHADFPKLCGAVVAEANLLLPDVEKTLKGLKEVQTVRGIRHSLAWSSDPEIAGAGEKMAKNGTAKDPGFRRGFELLEKYDLSYDVWMFHEQLEDLADLAKAFPNTTIILDHVAEPLGIGSYTRESTFPVWEKGMRELAKASQNVNVKLSGLAMCRTGFHWDDRPTPPSSAELAEAWAPYFRVVLDAFGVSRCMFASNFPVDRVSCDYTVLWNAYKLIVKDYSQEDKQALFYGNAKRVYRL
mmetsp:Transcript_24407/g.66628  ORF Transcript_24407/g.66628 Transcript_24407/m.66628 type:complete len:431 (-) Transcript_24407:78-1370(-)